MIVDSLRELVAGRVPDVCVVGAGPAGITVANGLAAKGHSVVLLEGGGLEYDTASQDQYRGTVVGDQYFELHVARLRQFGGTSGHWGGTSRPMDLEDFQVKAGISETAWPIKKADLDGYLDGARAILELPEFPPDKPLEGGEIKRVYFRKSNVRFAQKYLEQIRRSEAIVLASNANVTAFEGDGTRVTSVVVSDPDGHTVRLSARLFVLATGGIENSRILLWSNEVSKNWIVPDPRALGKYWMEHPHYSIGEAIVKTDGSFDTETQRRAMFSPTADAMRRHGILNCGLRLTAHDYAGTKKIIADLACLAPDLGRRLMEMAGQRLVCGANFRAAWEQAPVASNRIELSNEKDRLGVPRVRLFWKKGDLELRTVRRTAECFGRYLAQVDAGRLKLDDWVLGTGDYPDNDEIAGFHHMGGTRMSSSPATGIVDTNCQVFGQQNLYIAGSSVYPSCGHTNPTLTIVQLSLRLVDRLHNALG